MGQAIKLRDCDLERYPQLAGRIRAAAMEDADEMATAAYEPTVATNEAAARSSARDIMRVVLDHQALSIFAMLYSVYLALRRTRRYQRVEIIIRGADEHMEMAGTNGGKS